MTASWEQILDYVRGVAAPEVVTLIEQDPDAVDEVEWLRILSKSSEITAPANWINRAKALMVSDTGFSAVSGLLVFRRPTPAVGFRSGTTPQPFASLDHAGFAIEATSELVADLGERKIVGVIECNPPESIRIGTRDAWMTVGDVYGQFLIRIPSSERFLRIEGLETGKLIEIEIQDED